ncbi:Spy0128 family protein, partial [Barnesiella intestinihominis]|uniref:Spy0128 family protein n=1 Tax=Barnesiella intestinihominis TaxID=487174 RepID=UPI003AB8F75C
MVSIYATENGKKVGNALWTGTLSTNGDFVSISENGFAPNTTYIIEESGYELDGYTCTTSITVNGKLVEENGSSTQFTTGQNDSTTTIELHNHYRVDKKELNVPLSARKLLDGKAPLGSEFQFILQQVGGEYSQTVYNDGESITFDSLSFTEPGTYTYTLREAEGSDQTIGYDTSVYNIEVAVTRDETGSLAAETSITLDGESVDECVFNNAAKSGTLTISKVLRDAYSSIGGIWFRYEIVDSNTGEPLSFSRVFPNSYRYETGEDASVQQVSLMSGMNTQVYDIPYGTYIIREVQQHGYVINGISGRPSDSYTTDFAVIEIKADTTIVSFTNWQLTDKQSAVRLKKIAEGITDTEYPNPTVSIYATENGEAVGPALWTGTLPANGEFIYPTTYLTPDTTKHLKPYTTYIVKESGYEVDGYVTTKTDDTGTIVGDDEVTAAFKNTRNADGSLTVTKTLAGNDTDST